MRKQLRTLGELAVGLVTLAGSVGTIVVLWDGNGHVALIWGVAVNAYVVLLLVTGVLKTRRWFRDRARERIETEEFAQFLAEKRAAR